MRYLGFTILFLLLSAESAQAGPRKSCQCSQVAAVHRYPRIAAIERAIRATPSTLPRKPFGSAAVSAGFSIMSQIGSATLQTIATGGPQAIRLFRVMFIGSPLPGRPGETLLWITSPTLLTCRYALRELRGVRGGSMPSYPNP